MALWTDGLRRLVRGVIPQQTYHRLARWYSGRVATRMLGDAEYERLQRLATASPGGPAEAFRVPGLAAPVYARPGTTDAMVLEDNLLRRIYACYVPTRRVETILDAGANAGYASVYFLNRFPEARLIAVEPDAANVALTQKNLAPYGDRARGLAAAIWPAAVRLRIEPAERADGISVRAVRAGEVGDCDGVDPLTILEQAGWGRLSIFKCDIEGGEEGLFRERPDAWLQRTDCILIEIHSSAAHRAVYGAMSRHPFDARRYRELHVFVRRAV